MVKILPSKKLLVRSTWEGPLGKLGVGGASHRLAGSFVFHAR